MIYCARKWLRSQQLVAPSFHSGISQKEFQTPSSTHAVKLMKKILVIGPTPPPHNGMTQATLNLISSRLKDRYEFVLLDTSDRRGLSNIGKLDLRNVWLALAHGANFLMLVFTQAPNAILVPISQDRLGLLRDLLFLIPARILHQTVIVALHGSAFQSYYESESRWMRALLRFGLEKTAVAIVLGESLRRLFFGILPNERVVVVPNGLDGRALFGNGAMHSSSKVLFLSTLMPEKGYMYVIEAASQVLEKMPHARFIFAGEVFDRKSFETAQAYVRANALTDKIQFVGPLTGQAKLDAFHHAAIFVFPPICPEGHPFVILEAMAAGLPIVTTNQGAIAETIQDGLNGFIVPPRDANALAEKIVILLQNESLRQKMGEAGRSRFSNMYTLENWLERMDQVFTQVLEKK